MKHKCFHILREKNTVNGNIVLVFPVYENSSQLLTVVKCRISDVFYILTYVNILNILVAYNGKVADCNNALCLVGIFSLFVTDIVDMYLCCIGISVEAVKLPAREAFDFVNIFTFSVLEGISGD
ncbi:MAG: hypothetical protein IJA39_04000 [Clostridia bacterium]|nr:hypothetical protein [Clostridia bacterium]